MRDFKQRMGTFQFACQESLWLLETERIVGGQECKQWCFDFLLLCENMQNWVASSCCISLLTTLWVRNYRKASTGQFVSDSQDINWGDWGWRIQVPGLSPHKGNAQVLPNLLPSPPDNWLFRAYPSGLDLSHSADLRVVVLLRWKPISKRKEVGVPVPHWELALCCITSSIFIGQSSQRRWGNRPHLLMRKQGHLQKSMSGGSYCHNQLWKIQNTTQAVAVPVSQARRICLDLDVFTGEEKVVDLK